jgi:hypothetical protein
MNSVFYVCVSYNNPEEIVQHITTGNAAELISKYGLFFVATPYIDNNGPKNTQYWASKHHLNRWNELWTSIVAPQWVHGFVFELPLSTNSPFAVYDLLAELFRVLGKSSKTPYYCDANYTLTDNVRSLSFVIQQEEEEEEEEEESATKKLKE